MEWDGVGGSIIAGDDGVADGSMDYPTGAGSYDIGYGCPCLDETASNYCPDCGIDETDNTDNPCEYITDVPGCTDASADNYDPDATTDDGSCIIACIGSGTDDDATLAALGANLGVSDCVSGVALAASYGADCTADLEHLMLL